MGGHPIQSMPVLYTSKVYGWSSYPIEDCLIYLYSLWVVILSISMPVLYTSKVYGWSSYPIEDCLIYLYSLWVVILSISMPEKGVFVYTGLTSIYANNS